MFGTEQHDYPTALAADPAQADHALATAIDWTIGQRRRLGGYILVYAPGKQNIEDNLRLRSFCARPGVIAATWRQRPRWEGGPVLAAWPTREKLAELAEWPSIRALCVVPWVDGEVDAWAQANDPELLEGATAPRTRAIADPVVIAGLTDLTRMVNHSNNLAGALDHRDAVAVLRTLHDGGHRLDAEAIYAWALANGWPGRGAERLRDIASRIASGVRMQMRGGSPLRRDILEVWRAGGDG